MIAAPKDYSNDSQLGVLHWDGISPVVAIGYSNRGDHRREMLTQTPLVAWQCKWALLFGVLDITISGMILPTTRPVQSGGWNLALRLQQENSEPFSLRPLFTFINGMRVEN